MSRHPTPSAPWLLPLAALVPLLAACATAGEGPGLEPAPEPGPAMAPAPTPALADPGDPHGTRAVIDSVTSAAPLHRTHWGVLAVAADGTRLVELNADKLFITASNLKVVSTAAALDLLGPDYRFRTVVEAPWARAPAAQDEVSTEPEGVASALVVRGSGDPSFSEFFHGDDPLAPLDALADSLAAAGLRRVDGPVLIDQSRYDSLRVHPAWEHGDLDWYYAAPVAPFAVMEGAIPVVMRPGAPGERADVDVLAPDGLFGVDAAVLTAADSGRWNDALRRVPGTDSLVLRGFMGPGVAADTSWIAQDDPGRVAGRALVMALERAGIAVTGSVRVTYDAAEARAAAAGPGARVAWESPPLLEMIWLPLERSDNWVAEQLLRTIGVERAGQGSWSAATEVVERWLVDGVGLDSTAVYLRDGSGLSAQNLLTPEAMVTLLRWAAGQPWGGSFRAAMAAPGVVDGTLEDRLEGFGARVAAKTGTIRHVNTLSGYLETLDGRDLVFCIMTNGSARPAREVRAAIDRIVESLITSGS